MDMSVAPLMAQRNVEDCPASTVVGSAVKLLITGAPWRGGAISALGGGGGGGGGGTFLAQPTANNTSTDSNISMPVLDACNLELSLILKSPLLGLLVRHCFYCVALLQTGFSLFPCVVSGCTPLPSASMV